MKKLVLLFTLTLLTACNETSKELDADAIVAHAIEAAGGKTIDTALISFKFRDKFYNADRNYRFIIFC